MEEQPAQQTPDENKPAEPVLPNSQPAPQNLHPEEWFAPDETQVTSPRKLPAFSKIHLMIAGAVLSVLLIGGGVFALVSKKTDSTPLVTTDSSQQETTSDGLETDTQTNDQEDAGTEAEQPTPDAQPATANGGASAPNSGSSQPAGPTAATHTMPYTFNGCYSPRDITVKAGDTIRFVNNDDKKDMWPASDSHPSHTIYPEFDAGRAIAPHSSWDFTFTTKGSWGYHDHLKSSCGGTITVQ